MGTTSKATHVPTWRGTEPGQSQMWIACCQRLHSSRINMNFGNERTTWPLCALLAKEPGSLYKSPYTRTWNQRNSSKILNHGTSVMRKSLIVLHIVSIVGILQNSKKCPKSLKNSWIPPVVAIGRRRVSGMSTAKTFCMSQARAISCWVCLSREFLCSMLRYSCFRFSWCSKEFLRIF